MTDFQRNPQYQISPKSVQWELRWYMQTGLQRHGRTNMTEAIDAFRDYAKAAKNAEPSFLFSSISSGFPEHGQWGRNM
jgi:hypothetical protein